MKVTKVIGLTPKARFLYWIKERYSIRCKRALKLAPPWTDDEILAKYRFCNVRRMDDAVSNWLLRHWYQPHKNQELMLVAVTLARHLNLPDVLAEIGFPTVWSPEKVKLVVRQRLKAGSPAFNSAYMVRGIETVDKIAMVVDRVIQPLLVTPPKLRLDSMEASVNALLPYWGFSWFMAGQVVADLRWALSGSWRDRHTWAAPGPGSLRGLNRLHGRPLKQPVKEFQAELSAVIAECKASLPLEITKRLEAIDYQNCLCEYDKYVRTLLGEGKPKRLFKQA